VAADGLGPGEQAVRGGRVSGRERCARQRDGGLPDEVGAGVGAVEVDGQLLGAADELGEPVADLGEGGRRQRRWRPAAGGGERPSRPEAVQDGSEHGVQLVGDLMVEG